MIVGLSSDLREKGDASGGFCLTTSLVLMCVAAFGWDPATALGYERPYALNIKVDEVANVSHRGKYGAAQRRVIPTALP